MPRNHLDKLFYCLLAYPCPNLHLQVSRESMPWMQPGCCPALGSCCVSYSLCYLPAGGCWDVNQPGISNPMPYQPQVQTMPRWCTELKVPKLWWAGWTLVCGGGHPWVVHHQCTPQPGGCRCERTSGPHWG